MKAYGYMGMKICTNEWGHMAKVTFKNLLLQNQLTDGLGTWYVALGT